MYIIPNFYVFVNHKFINPENKMIDITPFRINTARSFHKRPTKNQPTDPSQESNISSQASCVTPEALIVIAVKIIKLETHLIYQLISYLGVADLKILFEFFNSFGSKSTIINSFEKTGPSRDLVPPCSLPP